MHRSHSHPSASTGHGSIVRCTARVPTVRSARYAKQLCSHAAWKASRVQWTEPTGVIEFPGGTGNCRIVAESDCLVLTVEATHPADLARIQEVIGSNIQRFAAREHLTVRWIPG